MTFLTSMFTALWGRVAGYVVALGALLTILFGAWAKGRKEGKEAMRAEQERARQAAVANKRKLDDEIDALGPADLDARLARWMRKDAR